MFRRNLGYCCSPTRKLFLATDFTVILILGIQLLGDQGYNRKNNDHRPSQTFFSEKAPVAGKLLSWSQLQIKSLCRFLLRGGKPPKRGRKRLPGKSCGFSSAVLPRRQTPRTSTATTAGWQMARGTRHLPPRLARDPSRLPDLSRPEQRAGAPRYSQPQGSPAFPPAAGPPSLRLLRLAALLCHEHHGHGAASRPPHTAGCPGQAGQGRAVLPPPRGGRWGGGSGAMEAERANGLRAAS